MTITKGDTIRLQKSDGQAEEVPWSLPSYPKLSGLKHQSHVQHVQKVLASEYNM